MRNPILRFPVDNAEYTRHRVLREAVRQLERAEIYLTAVSDMEIEDRAASRALNQLRVDARDLRRHLSTEPESPIA